MREIEPGSISVAVSVSLGLAVGLAVTAEAGHSFAKGIAPYTGFCPGINRNHFS